MTLQLDEFKTRQRDIWSAGEYGELSPYIADVGEAVVACAALTPGMRLLDVACGTGNVARPAARAGALVTGLDLTPKLIEIGRARATAEGLDIDWREGDAENLPFDAGSFDRVTSTFGHMFAPHHQRTADEMARVCRRGGVIVTATWTPDGTVGDVFKTAASFMPPPPPDVSPPILWGTEDYVRARLCLRAADELDRVGVARGVRGVLYGPLRPDGNGASHARGAVHRIAGARGRDLAAKERGGRRRVPSAAGIPLVDNPKVINSVGVSWRSMSSG
jgi:SAM-dependent methyltransferase